MKAIIYISGVIGQETTLTDAIRQYKSYEEPDAIELKIHSEGGNVDKGDSIYDYFKRIKDSGVPLDTWTDKAYSISAKLFSLGTERTVEEGEKRIMIHFPWAEIKGGADKFEIAAEYLRNLEDDFAVYYSEFLDVDEETARSLLDNNTFLSGSEAVELGFATKLETAAKAVALYTPENNLKTEQMKQGKKKSLKDRLLDFLNAEAEVNALVLQDSNGTEIEFKDVEDGETPKVGDAGTIDGEPVKDGEYVMPQLDDATVKFVDGKIDSITEAETEESEEDEDVDANAQEDVDANAEEVQQISVWTQEATNTSFEVGEQMTYEYDGETYNYGAGEYYVPSIDKNVVTDASGVIVAHKDKVVVAETDDAAEVADAAEAKEVEEVVKAIEKKIENKISAKYDKELKALKKSNEDLKKMVGSKEIDVNAQEEGDGKKKGSGNYLAGVLRS